MDLLKEKFFEVSSSVRKDLRALVKENARTIVDQVAVGQVFGGMRGVKSMIWETSNLDPIEGIKFRGHNIPHLKEQLPRLNGSTEPLPEGLFWLMLVGEMPTEEQVAWLADEWERRRIIPDHTFAMLETLDPDTHPMTQFSMGILSLQTESVFAQQYADGVHKSEYWDATYEDSMNLIARLPGWPLTSTAARFTAMIRSNPTTIWTGVPALHICWATTVRAFATSCACI